MAYTMSTRSLYITDLSGRNLPDEKKIGKQSPYIKFEVGDVTAKTSKDSKGGSNPSWDDEVRLEIPAGASELSVYVYSDHTLLPDKLVAQGRVALSNASSGTTTVNLVDKSGNKDAGELFLRLSGDFGGSTGNTYATEDENLAGRTSNMGITEGYGTGAAAAGVTAGTAVGTAPTYGSGYKEGRTTDTYDSSRDDRTMGDKVKDTLGMGGHHQGHGTENYGRTGTDVGGATIGRGYEDPSYNRSISDDRPATGYASTGTYDDRTSGEKVKDTLGMGGRDNTGTYDERTTGEKVQDTLGMGGHHRGHGTEGYGRTGADVGGATIGRGYEDPTYNRGTSDTTGYDTTGTYTQTTGQGYDTTSGYNTSGMGTDTRSDNRTFVEKAKDAVGMGNKDNQGMSGSEYNTGYSQTGTQDNRTFVEKAKDAVGMGNKDNQGMRGSEYGTGTGYSQTGTQDNRTFVEKAKDAVGMGGRQGEYDNSGYTGTGMTSSGTTTGTGIATGTYTSTQPMSGSTGYDATRGNEGYDRYDTTQGTRNLGTTGYNTGTTGTAGYTTGTDTYNTGTEYESGRDNRGLGEKVKDTLGMGNRDTTGTYDDRTTGEKVKDTLGMGQRGTTGTYDDRTTGTYDDRTTGDKVKDTLGMGGRRTGESDYDRGYDENVSGQQYGTGVGTGMGATDYTTNQSGYDTTTQGQTYTTSDTTPGQDYSTTGTQGTGYSTTGTQGTGMAMGSDRYEGQNPQKKSSIVDKIKSVVGIPVGDAAEGVGRGTVMNERDDQYDSRVDQPAYRGTSYPGTTTQGQYTDATPGQGYSTTESYGTGIGQAKDATHQQGHKGGILDKVKAVLSNPTADPGAEAVGTGQKNSRGSTQTSYN